MFFFIPYGTTRRMRRWPYATAILLGANVLVYLWSLAVGSDAFANVEWRYGFVPERWSALTLFTHQYLHAGLLHLVGNMIFLLVFGGLVEDALGPLPMLVFYSAGGVAAALMQWGMTAAAHGRLNVPMVGASGAIAALLGISALRFYAYQVKIWWLAVLPFGLAPRVYSGAFAINSWFAIGTWVLMQLVPALYWLARPVSEGVAYWAHLGGLGFGVLLALPLGAVASGRRDHVLEEAEVAPIAHAHQVARLVQHEPDNEDALVLAARGDWKMDRLEEAAQAYQRAVAVAIRKGKRAKAADIALEMFTHIPEAMLDADSLYQVGCLMEEISSPERAVQAYCAMVARHRDHRLADLAAYRCGRICLDKLGDPGEAAVWFQRVIDLYPQSEWRPHAERGLQGASAGQG